MSLFLFSSKSDKRRPWFSLSTFKRVVNRLSVWGAVASCVILLILMLLATVHGVGRKFGYPVPNAPGIGENLMLGAAFLGVAYVAMRRGHVNIELLTQRMAPRVQAALDAIVAMVGVILYGILTWSSGVVGWKAFTIRESQIAEFVWPLWPFRILLCLGLGLFVLQLVVTAITEIDKARRSG